MKITTLTTVVIVLICMAAATYVIYAEKAAPDEQNAKLAASETTDSYTKYTLTSIEWNKIIVDPHINGNTLRQIIGTCHITDQKKYDTVDEQYKSIDIDTILNLGEEVIIKVSQTCELRVQS